MRRAIVGLGQVRLGDEIGHSVIDVLEQRRLPDLIELRRIDHPVLLVPLLRARARVVLVDGIIGSPAGQVLELDPEHLASAEPFTTAPAFGIAEAVELSRALESGAALPRLRVVLVTVARPGPLGIGRDPALCAGIARASERALALARLPAPPATEERRQGERSEPYPGALC